MNYKDYETMSGEKDFAGGVRGYEAVSILRTRSLYSIGQMASAIAERFALIAGIPDGEDTAGRQKLRLPTADELAARSCDIAASLWAEFEKRGWMFDVPLPAPLKDKKAQLSPSDVGLDV